MSDYLWDGSGPADPEVARLEAVLRPLRIRDDLRVAPRRAPEEQRVLLRAAVVLALLLGGVAALTLRRPAGWEVATLAGAPRVAGRLLTEGGAWLREGQWIETDAASRARLRVAAFGEVEVSPGSRLKVARARRAEQRLALERGRIDAFILARPGSFLVQTPSALAVDLGCAYSLEVDAGGAGRLAVAMGWVSFARAGRESFVPAGAECLTRPGIGPGTPFFGDASPAFVAALRQLDFPDGAGSPDVLAVVLREARPRDALTLWHLLSRVGEGERGAVHDRLAAHVAVPAGVTREGIVAGDGAMRDLWWDALGLGTAGFWRSWRIPAP